LPYIDALTEMERGVLHRPSQLYQFNVAYSAYEQAMQRTPY